MTNSGAVTADFNLSNRRGGLICIIGPSGSGKSSIIKELCRRDPTLIESISTTTRAARPGEHHGVDYNFITAETFNLLAARGAFLQHVTYNGVSYGTLREPVEQALHDGRDTLFAVTLDGRNNLAQHYPGKVTSIFICPPSAAILEQRLRGRGTDSEEVINRRMRSAAQEIEHLNSCDYAVLNDKLEAAVEEVQTILAAERLLRARQTGLIKLGDAIRHSLLNR